MEPQVAAAIAAARAAVVRQPESAGAWGHLGKVLHAHNAESAAEVSYAEARKLAPEDFQWAYLLAELLRRIDPARGLEHAEDSLRVNGSYVPSHIVAGRLQLSLGRAQQAKTHFETALALDQRCALAAFLLARIYLDNGNLRASEAYLKTAIRLQPESGVARDMLTRVYRLQGDEDRAQAEAGLTVTLDATIELDDPVLDSVLREAVSSSALSDLAQRAAKQGDFEEAGRRYRQLVEISPQDPTHHYNYATNAITLRQYDVAETHYLKTLALRPDHFKARMNLADLLTMTRRQNEAAPHYQLALDSGSDRAAALQGLGRVRALNGDLDGALELLHQALDSTPESASVNRDLSLVYEKQGNSARANHYARRAGGLTSKGAD